MPPDSTPDAKPQVVLADTGGWLSGPCLDDLPDPLDEMSVKMLRDLGSMANQLAGLDHVASMHAYQASDDAFQESAHQLLQLHVKFAEQYRSYLVRRRHAKHAAPANSVAVTGPDRMST